LEEEPVAVESRVDADDDWFVGEDRVWRFRFVEGDVSDVVDWSMTLAFYSRKARESDPPLLTVPAVGIVGGGGQPALAVATVTAADSASLGAGLYQFVLRRSDTGHRTVLSYGPAQLRSAVTG
jgi:hypothetical protein